jgi:two-component system sensor histidine kinase DctS
MSFIRLPIQSKITILSFGVVLFSLLIGGIILIGNFVSLTEEEYGNRAMITARTVAQLPEIQKNITQQAGWTSINPMVDRIRIINNVDYIVVLNQERIRYSHPVTNMLGTISEGEDEGPAFAEHTYMSKAKGEIGTAIRAFVPILNPEREQIGVVIAGNLLPPLSETILDLRKEIAMIMFLTLLFGVCGSWLLARHIKDQMFKLEPHEIVRMFEERTATFHAMHEGIIAIDNHEVITIFNEKAKQMLCIEGDVIGKPIREVIHDTRLPEMLQLKHPIYNQEIQVRQTNIMSNRVPIKVNGKTVGAVAIFQDRTEVTKMAEELTGVRAFVEALRVQNHEHMNKLHTIAGLIQLGNQEQALQYVFQVSEEQEELTKFLSKNIHDDSVSGLLLSKVSRGKELGIKVVIDRKSKLNHFPKHLDQHDFVLILGNLIENAFAALEQVDHEDKRIDISIEQNDGVCALLVEDNGCGITENDLNHIFEQGFSTKGAVGYGLGLYLVYQIIEKGLGTIEVVSHPNEGTSFFITFPVV